MRRLIPFLTVLISLGIVLASAAPASAQLFETTAPVGGPSGSVVAAPTGQEAQFRGLWVDAYHDGAKSPVQIDRLLADARRANINALIIQVRKRGDAYYTRGPEPRADDPALPAGFDPLDYLIERAHGGSPRLEVHAWIATLPVWGDQNRVPRDPGHVFNQHGLGASGREDWLTRREDGESWATGYFLDPGHPDAARYTADVALNLVREYDLDGLHLDYIRFPDSGTKGGWGYNETSVARFNARHGRAGKPDPTDAQWGQWRRDQVSALVRRIYVGALAIKPQVKVSAAVIPWGAGPQTDADWLKTAAYGAVFQDWRAWLEEGILDLAIPMNYFREAQAPQGAWFDRWVAWQRERTYGRQTAAGLGLYLNSPSDGIGQLKRALAAGPSGARLAGVALYSYAQPRRTPAGGDATEEAIDVWAALASPGPANGGAPPFANPAAVPPMEWKVAPKAGALVVRTPGLDGARVDLSGPTGLSGEADGNGLFVAAQVTPGEYTVTVRHGALGEPRTLEAQVAAGGVTELELR